jgi:hypothetical protein
VLLEPSSTPGTLLCVEAALGEHSPRVEIDGEAVQTATRMVAAGGYVLTFTTVLPSRGIELNSTYTVHPEADVTLVSELFLCRSRRPLLIAREAEPGRREALLYWRGSCFYDHLWRLQELLAERRLGHVTVAGLENAIEALVP